MPSWTAEALERAAFARLVRHDRTARRVRLEVPGLRGDELMARRLERLVIQQGGVETVTADPRSGRVLITYRHGARFFDRLKKVGRGGGAGRRTGGGTGIASTVLGPKLKPVALALGEAGYWIVDAIAVAAARRREDLADLLAEARAPAGKTHPSGWDGGC